jgi:hypothetical protein
LSKLLDTLGVLGDAAGVDEVEDLQTGKTQVPLQQAKQLPSLPKA